MSNLIGEATHALTLNSICNGVEKVFHLLKHDSRVSHPLTHWHYGTVTQPHYLDVESDADWLIYFTIQEAIPITSYPTPISAQKRKLGNNANNDSSSNSDTSDEDSPNFRKAQGQNPCDPESLYEREPRNQQPKGDVPFRTPTLTPDNLRSTTAILDTGNEKHAEPQQGLASPSSHTKSRLTRRKSSNAKDIGGRPNQRTLKQAGFTAVSKPHTSKDKRKDPGSKMASNDAGRALQIRATSPTIISDDESLPRSPREHFGLKNLDEERFLKEEHAEISLQNAEEPSEIGTPSKRRKTGGPSILRSSNTIKARKLPKRRPPLVVLHTEEQRLESALCPTSVEAQLSDPPPDECRIPNLSKRPSVDDSVGSPTPRELSRAPSIDLGNPPSETTILPEDSILPGLPLAENRSTSRQTPNLEEATSNVESSHRSESRSSVNFWVLRTSKPHNKWIHWADATLFHETIDSMFNALGDFVGNPSCDTIDVQLQTPQEEYSFQLQRDHSDRFEAMKAFMLQIIDASHRGRGFNHTVISIYLRLGIELA